MQEQAQLKPSVRQVTPPDGAGLKEFIKLERKLVGDKPLFVSETDSDLKRYLSGRSAFYDAIEHTMFVASNERGLAACAAFVNRRPQESHHEPVGFMGYFAAAPRAERQVREMLGRAEGWLAARDVTRAIAPVNGAGLIGFGLQTAAFGEEPMFPSTGTRPTTSTTSGRRATGPPTRCGPTSPRSAARGPRTIRRP